MAVARVHVDRGAPRGSILGGFVPRLPGARVTFVCGGTCWSCPRGPAGDPQVDCEPSGRWTAPRPGREGVAGEHVVILRGTCPGAGRGSGRFPRSTRGRCSAKHLDPILPGNCSRKRPPTGGGTDSRVALRSVFGCQWGQRQPPRPLTSADACQCHPGFRSSGYYEDHDHLLNDAEPAEMRGGGRRSLEFRVKSVIRAGLRRVGDPHGGLSEAAEMQRVGRRSPEFRVKSVIRVGPRREGDHDGGFRQTVRGAVRPYIPHGCRS